MGKMIAAEGGDDERRGRCFSPQIGMTNRRRIRNCRFRQRTSAIWKGMMIRLGQNETICRTEGLY